MSRLASILLAIALAASAVTPCSEASAAPPSAESELASAEQELSRAQATDSAIDRRTRAEAALGHFAASYELLPSWRAAAGASDASLVLGSSAEASGWYWIASNRADYSEAYLAWQTGALARVFDGRAAFTLEFSEPASALRIDGVNVPGAEQARPLALDVGTHAVVASALSGNTFQGTLEVEPSQVGGRHFYAVHFTRLLKAGEDDPLGPATRARPKPDSDGMGALQIATIVGTVALAAGIAVGGGYLLFGEDNPRGIDSPEGAVVIITELVLIGGGTAIALLSD